MLSGTVKGRQTGASEGFFEIRKVDVCSQVGRSGLIKYVDKLVSPKRLPIMWSVSSVSLSLELSIGSAG